MLEGYSKHPALKPLYELTSNEYEDLQSMRLMRKSPEKV
jgi:hypothetical protein